VKKGKRRIDLKGAWGEGQNWVENRSDAGSSVLSSGASSHAGPEKGFCGDAGKGKSKSPPHKGRDKSAFAIR